MSYTINRKQLNQLIDQADWDNQHTIATALRLTGLSYYSDELKQHILNKLNDILTAHRKAGSLSIELAYDRAVLSYAIETIEKESAELETVHLKDQYLIDFYLNYKDILK